MSVLPSDIEKGISMSRRILILGFVLCVAFIGLGTNRSNAASPGDFLKFTYLGGGVCQATYVSVPVRLQVQRAAAEPYTTIVSLNGTVFGSWTGTDPAGPFDGNLNYGESFAAQSFPYTYQWRTIYTDDTFTINAVCFSAGSEPVVSIASIPTVGPAKPDSFVLKTIACTVAVYDSPAGKPVGDNKVTSGQTWFVSPTAVKGKDGQNWTEIFVGSYLDGFIPTKCVR